MFSIVNIISAFFYVVRFPVVQVKYTKNQKLLQEKSVKLPKIKIFFVLIT